MPLPSFLKRGMNMCRNLKDFLKIPILISFFVFFVPCSSLALVDTAQVSCDPDTYTIISPTGIGEKFFVDIVVDENANDLTQCEIGLSCDKNVLAIDSVSKGSIWTGAGSLFSSVFIDQADSHRVFIIYGLLGFDAYVNGPGVLAKVYFRTKGYGESDIVFDSLTLRGSLNDPIIPSKAKNGTVIVQSESTAVNSTDEENVIFGYSLGQNYPNPFNPSTCIDFDLPRTSQVKLVVYNILGRKVRTLINQKLGAGHRSVNWDAKDDQGTQVASGIYFYQLKAEEFSLTKRMLLLR
jgi:hypothetical protein